MRILFDGMLIDAHFLQDVGTEASETADKFDAVSYNGDDKRILGTFDSEREAKDFVNKIGEKISEAEHDDVVDVRS